MFEHVASVLPFPGVSVRRSAAPRGSRRPSRAPQGARLDLRAFVHLLAAEGLSDRLPDLERQVAALSAYNRCVFGFTFNPSEVRIPERDLPWLLLGLREGILTRPLVIDSPRAIDAVRLGIDLACPILTYRLEQLALSGIHFRCAAASWEVWRELRWPRHGPLADRVGRLVGARSASYADLAAVYDQLPPSPTIGERLGVGPRFLLVGPNWEERRNRVLAARTNGAPVVKTLASWRSAAFALDEGCRFLSPEAALLLLGTPGVRDGDSTFLASDGPIWLSALNRVGRVAMLQSESSGVVLSCGDPKRVEPFDRLPACSE